LAFSAFTLDLRGGQLIRAGRPVPLRPKTWAVLVYLAQRPGTLISRDELLDALWPDVAVTPDTLTKSIGELRVALGDDTRRPRFIETVHRRGFRFLDTPRGAATAAAAGGERPFVGRDAELQQLGECLDRACRGERQMVFVSGAAGVGKTSLIEAFLRSPAVQRPGSAVAWGASIAQHGAREPYMPVLEALERLARGDACERVTALLHSRAPSWLAQLPWLAGTDAAAWQHSPAVRPERMLRDGVALLEGLAADLTLVLALEDLHSSDPSTIDLLVRIGQRREPARLLVLVTHRAAEVAVHEHPLGGALRSLRGLRRCIELPLHELSRDAVLDYLGRRFSGAVLPPGLAAALHRHTDGNPLFLRAVVDHLVAQAWILDTAPGWSFAAMPAQPAFGVPDDARDMVRLQIDGLAPADRRVLEAVGVAGREATASLLAAALGGAVDEVEQSCETLAEGERFLRATGGGSTTRFNFCHELYRQAIYGDIPAARRRRLHRAMGAALESALGGQAAEQAAALAHHFERGGEIERARQYLGAAAARARQRGAPREAGEYLEQALELIGRLPPSDARRRHELETQLALAPVLLERDGPGSPALRLACERALALCSEADGPLLRFTALYALCHVRAMRGEAAGLDVACAALDELATPLGAEPRRLADSVLCRTSAYRARFVESLHLAERIMAARVGGEAEAEQGFGSDPMIAARNHFAFCAWMLGDLTRARAATDQLASVAVDASAFTRASAGFFVCLLAMLERDPERIVQHSEIVLALCEEHGFVLWVPMTNALRGWAQVQQGAIDQGLGTLRAARAAHAAAGTVTFSTVMLAFLAEGHLRAGDPTAGLAAVDEGLAIADTTIEQMWVPELWRIRGELLFAAGRPADGEAALQRALDEARAIQARVHEVRAALALATHWRNTGRAADGRAAVRAALSGISDRAAHPDLDAARSLLAASTAGRRSSRTR
jgi:DNA-binding winged helix-turn-helix (wHTH) protein